MNGGRSARGRAVVLALWAIYLLHAWIGPPLGPIAGRHVALAEAFAAGRLRVAAAEAALSGDFAYPDGPAGGGVAIFGFASSALAVPLVWFSQALTSSPPAARALAASLFIALFCALPTALAVLLLARFGRRLGTGRPGLAGLLLGLGTVAFPLATVVQPQSLTLLGGIGAWLLLWRARPDPDQARAGFAAGGLSGLTVLFDYGSLLVFAVPSGLAALALLRGRARWAFVGGAGLTAGLLLAWNTATLGHPLAMPPPATLDADLNYLMSRGLLVLEAPTPRTVWEVLFGERIGLFFFMPVLLLGVWGLGPLWRRDRAAAVLCGSVALLTLVQTACHRLGFHGGPTPGPRYLALAALALAVPLGDGLARAPRALVAVLAGFSCFAAWVDAQTPFFGTWTASLLDLTTFGPRLRWLYSAQIAAGVSWVGRPLFDAVALLGSALLFLPLLVFAGRALVPRLPQAMLLRWGCAVWLVLAAPALVLGPRGRTRHSLRLDEVTRLAAREQEPLRLLWNAEELLQGGRLAAAEGSFRRALSLELEPDFERRAQRGLLACQRERQLQPR